MTTLANICLLQNTINNKHRLTYKKVYNYMGKKIAIIGGGNLGVAIAEGLLKSKFSKASELIVTKRNTTPLKDLEKKGVYVTSDNTAATRKSDVIIIAVKPFQVTEVLDGLKKELGSGKILISVVTGVTTADMKELLKNKIAMFRAMPNTAIAIQESMTCICQVNANKIQIEYVEGLFRTLGKVVTIEEKLMEA